MRCGPMTLGEFLGPPCDKGAAVVLGYDIHVWSRQALGRLASLISWAPLFKHFIRWQARKKLDAYMSTQTVAPSEGIIIKQR